MNNVFDCLIIGAGPGGIGAALELKKNNYNIAIIERDAPGGKVNIAPRVDNYPGFTKIPGPDLAYELYKRIKNSGVEIIPDEVISLEKNGDLFKISCKNDTFLSKTAIVASGTKEKKLGLDREDELIGHGISYCAICDGHFYKGKDILVGGGGNSAFKEAIYLSNIVNHLYLIHRRNQFRASDKLVNELREKKNVTILTPYIPLEILADDNVYGIKIKNLENEQIQDLKVQGFFPLVGQIPNTQFVKIPNVLNEWNTIPVDKKMETSCPNLFAVGDVLPREIKQIYLSEHDGMVAAKRIIEILK